MKIKIFRALNVRDLEDEVNEFISDKAAYCNITFCPPTSDDPYYQIMVVYEEMEKEDGESV